MPITVNHIFTSPIADGTNTQLVKPSDWNSSHQVAVSLATNEVIKYVSAGTESISSGTLVFANSNGVSFGMNAGTITATVIPGAAAGIAAIEGGTSTATNGTVVFGSSAGNITFGLSNGYMTASGPAGGGGGGAALQGSGTYTQNTGTVQFANSNGITFGLSNNGTMTASHNGLTQQSTQPVAYSAANGSANFSTITFANSNGVSFSTGTQGIYATVKTDYQTAGAYLTTARASNDAIGLNTALTGNGVLVTANSSGLSINVPAFLTTAMQTGSQSQLWIMGNSSGTVGGTNISGTVYSNGMSLSVAAPGGGGGAAISAGANSQNTGTVNFSNANGVTFGLSNNGVMTASVAAAGGAQTGISGISAGTQMQTAGTMQFLDSNGITWGMANSSQITATVKTDYQSSNANYLTSQSNQAVSAGTQASSTFQTLSFANSNGVSWSTGTQGLYATVVTSYQPAGAYLTTARASNDAIGLNSALTAGGVNASVSMTANSLGLSLNFPAFLTTAGLSGDTTKYAGVGSAITNGLMTFNTAGLSLNLSAHLTTAAQSSVSNVSAIYAATNNTGGGTATLSGGVSFSNANSVTFYTSAGNAIAISLPAYLTTAMQTGSQSQLWIMGNSSAAVGGTNISGTMYSNGLSLSVAAGGGGADGGNTLAVAGSTAGSNSLVLFSNSPTVTFGMAGNTITASAAGGGGGGAYTAKWFQPELYGATTTIQHNAGNLILRPFEINNPIDFDQLVLQQSFASSLSTYRMSGSISAGNASSGTATWGQTITALLFSRVNTDEANASYNSIISFMSETAYVSAGYSASCSWTTNVSSATCSWTTSGAVGFLKNIDQTGGVTYGSTATSGSSTFSSTSTNANSFSSSYAMSFPYAHLSGVRPFIVQGDGANLSAGEYWLGIRQSTQTGSTNFSMQQVAMMGTSPGLMIFTASANSYLEYGNSAAINSSNWRLGFGSITGGTLTTTQLALSQFTSAGSNASLYFAINGYTK